MLSARHSRVLIDVQEHLFALARWERVYATDDLLAADVASNPAKAAWRVESAMRQARRAELFCEWAEACRRAWLFPVLEVVDANCQTDTARNV